MTKLTLTLTCQDRVGIVAAVTGFLARHDGFIIESGQVGDPYSQLFFMRVLFTIDEAIHSLEELNTLFAEVGNAFGMQWEISPSEYKPRVLIMVSKQGHCLNTLLNKYAMGVLPIEVPAVVSNHTDLSEMCSWYKIPFFHMPITKENKEEQEKKLLKMVQEQNIDLVVLARYMQILSPLLTEGLWGRCINIHHSFLPSFKGARPYHQAFERGVKLIGATAHYVSDNLDEGPIIEQEVMRVDHGDHPEDLVSIGHDIESLVLVRAVKYHIEKRIFINDSKTVVFR